MRQLRQRRLQQLQIFPAEIDSYVRKSGDVASRPREAGDKSDSDRIRGRDHDDRYRRRRLLRGLYGLCCRGHDDINLQPDQLARQIRQAIEFLLRPAGLDDDGLTFYVTKITQSGTQPVEPEFRESRRGRVHIADPGNSRLGK
jgi:hypothetical protein